MTDDELRQVMPWLTMLAAELFVMILLIVNHLRERREDREFDKRMRAWTHTLKPMVKPGIQAMFGEKEHKDG